MLRSAQDYSSIAGNSCPTKPVHLYMGPRSAKARATSAAPLLCQAWHWDICGSTRSLCCSHPLADAGRLAAMGICTLRMREVIYRQGSAGACSSRVESFCSSGLSSANNLDVGSVHSAHALAIIPPGWRKWQKSHIMPLLQKVWQDGEFDTTILDATGSASGSLTEANFPPYP